MARVRARWIVLGVVIVVAAFAVAIGGFLWPRPQFREGRAPWTLEERATPADSLGPGAPTEAPMP